GGPPPGLPDLRNQPALPWSGVDRPGHHPARPVPTPRPTRQLGTGHRRGRPQPRRRPAHRPLAHHVDRRRRSGHLARPHPHPPQTRSPTPQAPHPPASRLHPGPRPHLPPPRLHQGPPPAPKSTTPPPTPTAATPTCATS